MRNLESIIFLMTALFFLIAGQVFALTTNDPFFSQQWHLNKIGAPAAWDQTTGSSEVIVAVLDTGFDMDHPDLSANLWTNQNEVANDGIDNDGNGFVDDLHGYDFVGDDGDPRPDQNLPIDPAAAAHGTIIAGIIGAVGNNGVGVAGINWHVRLMNVRILNNEGSGDSIAARKAIEYAVKNGADVINLSFTGFQIDSLFKATLRNAYEAGVVVVAAVGNTKDGGINVDIKPIYPACHGENESEDWVIGVAASDKNDVKSDFSNYGALCTDISAPGENIASTTYQDDAWQAFASAFYESGWSGTSMAVPMVAGAAALLRSAYPFIGPEEIETVLRLSADPVTALGDAQGKVGAGRLNIANALALAPSFAKPIAASNLIPEVAPNALIKLVCVGQTKQDDPCRAVYFYGSDGKRHAFTNDKVFFTWFENFYAVKVVSASSMSSLPLGKNATYHPGTKLVKFQSAPTVYAVSKNGILREIDLESVAASLYGSDWNKKVDDISDAFFGNYTFGMKVTNALEYNVSAERNSVASLNQNF
jgi:hypothetical protein